MSKIDLPLSVRIRKFLGFRMVAIMDHDGEVVYRRARMTPFGLKAERQSFGIRPMTLNEDGSVFPDCYVKSWKDA